VLSTDKFLKCLRPLHISLLWHISTNHTVVMATTTVVLQPETFECVAEMPTAVMRSAVSPTEPPVEKNEERWTTKGDGVFTSDEEESDCEDSAIEHSAPNDSKKIITNTATVSETEINWNTTVSDNFVIDIKHLEEDSQHDEYFTRPLTNRFCGYNRGHTTGREANGRQAVNYRNSTAAYNGKEWQQPKSKPFSSNSSFNERRPLKDVSNNCSRNIPMRHTNNPVSVGYRDRTYTPSNKSNCYSKGIYTAAGTPQHGGLYAGKNSFTFNGNERQNNTKNGLYNGQYAQQTYREQHFPNGRRYRPNGQPQKPVCASNAGNARAEIVVENGLHKLNLNGL
jgi:hypothetical protein